MSEQQVALAEPPVVLSSTTPVSTEEASDVLSTPQDIAAHAAATGILGETTQPIAEIPVATTRLVPIELTGVNLFIELRVPAAAGESFEQTQSIIARLREKFGQDALVEELAQVVSGTIERVSISVPASAPQPAVAQPQQVQQAQPVQVHIPQTQQDVGAYTVQSMQTPWCGNALRNLDPMSIYKVLYDPSAQQLKNLLTNQDVTMMEAFYRTWYENQQRMGPGIAAQTFSNDSIPF